jgi:hypothetical protein
MTVKRRSPGQRLRRSRREDELSQIEARDPARAEALRELRRVSPQAFRKELLKAIRKGEIVRGRAYAMNPDELVLLDQGLPGLQDAVEERLGDGRFTFRQVAGLLEEERASRARPRVMDWLKATLDEVLDAEGRQLP